MRKLFLVAVLAASCGDSGPREPVDALVVVQETNLTACATAYSYDLMVKRGCDGTTIPVKVCSDVELCELQLAELTDSVAACANTEESFTATSHTRCD